MKCNIEFKGTAPQIQTQDLIKHWITNLEKKTQRLSSNEMVLRLQVEQNSARAVYPVSVDLELPAKNFAATEERHDLDESIGNAFAEIDRQLEAYKASLGGVAAAKNPVGVEKLGKIK